MGQALSEPVVEKHTVYDQDDTLVFGCSEMQGWRPTMEDAHATILNLDGKTGDEKASFFAVYDGHGGALTAKYAGQSLHKILIETDEYQKGNYPAALKRAFLGTDEALRAAPHLANDDSGCTAVAALLVKTPKTAQEKADETPHPDKPIKVARRIYVANAGDSRSVLAVSGEAKPMSLDHKPTNPEEHARIVAAGGFVEMSRVNGCLALSRALADFSYKAGDLPPEQQIVTANPEIEVYDITGQEEFLVLACDGIWDCLSSQQVVDFVRRGLANGKEPKDLCEQLMDKCLAPPGEVGGIGCDNMTIQVILLLNGRTRDEYYAWIKQRVDQRIGWDTPEVVPEVFRARGGTGLGPEAEPDDEEGHVNGPNVVSALSGSFPGGGEHDEEGPGLRLPAALVQALTGAGFVLRPGNETSTDGQHIYDINPPSSSSNKDHDQPSHEQAEPLEESDATTSSSTLHKQTSHQPETSQSKNA